MTGIMTSDGNRGMLICILDRRFQADEAGNT